MSGCKVFFKKNNVFSKECGAEALFYEVPILQLSLVLTATVCK
jgi:hypothetical protein